GMNKQQIMQLIGAPHFSEGIWGVREWNYLFNFRKPGSDEVTQCQYKVLFDEHKLARSFYWQPESCASRLVEKAEEVSTPAEHTFTVLSDALFVFDQSDVAHIRPGGMAQLESLAKKIEGRHDDVKHIHIVGYTDRLGSDAYNRILSEKRANTVLQVLQDHGVAAETMNAEGRGKEDPAKSCDDQARTALIACLAPNRRVEVRVEGKSN
ncbi:MAG TPA: OmpA family protein, partial [Rhodanobacter sp.]